MANESKGYAIEKLANDSGIHCELIRDTEDEAVIELSGDWKHEHIRFRRLVQDNFNVREISSITIGKSESDYYKAEYIISF